MKKFAHAGFDSSAAMDIGRQVPRGRSANRPNVISLKSKYRTKNRLNRTSNRSPSDSSLLLGRGKTKPTPSNTRAMISDHLCISILAVLCFFPTGLFGLIRAIQARRIKRSLSPVYWPKLAALYGRHALRWSVLSILIGTMLWTFFFIYRLLEERHPIWSVLPYSLSLVEKSRFKSSYSRAVYYRECGDDYSCF